ncbi:MAG: hypothetical protein ACRD8K_00175 [Nitrososphaeraceae archaeon]
MKGTFYANEQGSGFSNMESQNNLLDDFTISKKNSANNIRMSYPTLEKIDINFFTQIPRCFHLVTFPSDNQILQ